MPSLDNLFIIKRRLDVFLYEEMSEADARMVKAMSKLLKKVPIRANKIDARTSDPVLNAKLGIASVDAGEIIEVITNDSSLDDVLPIWAKKTGHKYLGHVPIDGCEHLFMRRGA